jgi:hypothetical protein
MKTFSGGCVCGAIRYEFSGEPIAQFKCHCSDCQHLGGGAFAAVVYVPKGGLKITGTPKHYATTSMATMGKHDRSFCGECGSRLFGGESERAVGIQAGTLDDASWFRPEAEIHVADAQPWDLLDPAVPAFAGYAPNPGA